MFFFIHDPAVVNLIYEDTIVTREISSVLV